MKRSERFQAEPGLSPAGVVGPARWRRASCGVGRAEKIGHFIKEIENQMGWTTQLTWSASTIEQRRFDGLRLHPGRTRGKGRDNDDSSRLPDRG
jgi:hypothetical protein